MHFTLKKKRLLICLSSRYCHPFRKLDAAAHEQVDDACLLTTPKHTIVVLGHARDHWQQQISLVTFDDDSSGRVSCSPCSILIHI